MAVPPIPGAQGGDGHSLHVWNYCNRSSIMKFGALVALDNRPGASPQDVLVFGEIKAPATTPAMVLVGVNSMSGPENSLTTALVPDAAGATNTPISSGLGRHKFILTGLSTPPSQASPYLMPDPATPGNVIAWDAASGCPPVARALDYPSLAASDQYIEGEFLAGSMGLSAVPGELVMGDATDAVVDGQFVPRAGLHTAPATAPETPVVFISRGRNWISGFAAKLSTAPGAGNGVRYEFRVGATVAAANAAAASAAVDILGTATEGTIVTGVGTPNGFWLSDSQVMVVKAVAQGAGVGAALHSIVSCRAQ